MARRDSVIAFARFEAARASGITTTTTPQVAWFSDRLKRKAAERAARLHDAQAARGAAGTAAIDVACRDIGRRTASAAHEARGGGERADIARWNAEAKGGPR